MRGGGNVDGEGKAAAEVAGANEAGREAPSAWRAWGALVRVSWQRQARAHLMVWIALSLLLFMTLFVALLTPFAWDMRYWRYPRRDGLPRAAWMPWLAAAQRSVPFDPNTSAIHSAVSASYNAMLRNEPVIQRVAFIRFTDAIVFTFFCTFLLPLWSLSFATEGFGREREAGNLLWVLTRPLSRPAIYLAKFVALLPWCLALNVGGLALLCWVAGEPGMRAFRIYWPPVLLGTLAFSALFHLMGVWFRRAAMVAILYSFFLETVMGNLPGNLKRASVSYYVRCVMYEAGAEYGIGPGSPLIDEPIGATAATVCLLGMTVAFLLVGMIKFSRTEYVEVN
jgi:ABC-type transport system involved in multi-copper enzyme maturation permease subunit